MQKSATLARVVKRSPSNMLKNLSLDKALDKNKETRDLEPRDQLRKLLHTVKAVRSGNFFVRMPLSEEGIISEIGEVLNDIIELNENMANEFIRVRDTVGQEGRMTERASIGSVKGAWATSVNSVNLLIGDLVQPTTEVARVITSVAKGDLSQKMSLEIDGRIVKGEFLRIGTTVNAMVDQLNSFASEVTRVAKALGVAEVCQEIEDNIGSLADMDIFNKLDGLNGRFKDVQFEVQQILLNGH